VALNFPDAPDNGDVYTYGGKSYVYVAATNLWNVVPPSLSQTTAVNTDGDAGGTIYVGSIDPDTLHTLLPGDIWIEPSA